MALLASYMIHGRGKSLSEYLAEEVFADAKILSVMPEEANKAEVDLFMANYKRGLIVERATVEQKE